MIFTLVVALAGIFYFYGVPAYSQYYDYKFQGQPDDFASEMPAPPIPPMTVYELLKVLIPACVGLTASALYALLSLVYFFRKIVFLRLTYGVAVLDIVARLLLSLNTPIFHPLPSFSQNMLAGIFFTGPFVLCGIFSFSLLFLLKKAE